MKTIFFRCFLAVAAELVNGDAGVRSVMVSNCMGRSCWVIKEEEEEEHAGCNNTPFLRVGKYYYLNGPSDGLASEKGVLGR